MNPPAAVTRDTVRQHFDHDVRRGRRLLPDRETASGLGTWLKYVEAARLMAEPEVRDVLDVGCNRGSVEFLFHQQHPDKAARTRVEGIDISPEAIREAQALRLPGSAFRSYDGGDLPFAADSFDLVVMVEVIEHVIDKARTLREIRRVLRPGGRLYLTTPNPECLTFRAENAIREAYARLQRRDRPHKDVFIPAAELRAMAAALGFEILEPRLYRWPHLYVRVKRRCVLPPLPARALYRYQRLCCRVLDHPAIPAVPGRRFFWSIVCLMRKLAGASADSGAVPPRDLAIGPAGTAR